MAKFYGKVGYSIPYEAAPDVWRENVVEHTYYGDVTRNYLRTQESQNGTIDNVSISNQISIVADPFAMDHFGNIKYVKWMNQKWKVTGVEVAYPRLLLTIGGVWNGTE